MAVATTLSTSLMPHLRAVLVGSGSDGLSVPAVTREILRVACRLDTPSSATVVYLGTATYDLPAPRQRQVGGFVALGCRVETLALADPLKYAYNSADQGDAPPYVRHAAEVLDRADIIVVSGGNTLFALRRWQRLGLVPSIRRAASRGAVLCGGSAGAICWFDGGHSDSDDPETYRLSMAPPGTPVLASGYVTSASETVAMTVVDGSSTGATAACEAPLGHTDESSAPPTESSVAATWQYIRVSGLHLIHGLCCPHYDRTQSNGVPRREDFERMLLHRSANTSQEVGICIDHWAALVIEGGGRFRVLSLPRKPGSLPLRGDSGHTLAADGAQQRRELEEDMLRRGELDGPSDDSGNTCPWVFQVRAWCPISPAGGTWQTQTTPFPVTGQDIKEWCLPPPLAVENDKYQNKELAGAGADTGAMATCDVRYAPVLQDKREEACAQRNPPF